MKRAYSLVEDLLNNLQLELVKPKKISLAQWSKAAGDRIAANSSVSGWNGETVIVNTTVPGIAMELKYRSSEIIHELNRLAGKEVFTALKVSLGPAREKERR
ncbi:hypothetical protein CSA37_07110 [Candidatus Fermentibacteria bacterium]|nr:MAG: hypothetical protein CSA37_10005 [Candidatus Fermentibacteria bacterium]PIE52327.1 MAG: hypothetical protein CSA37_07110 [Candidatus Fermentibacteria bacterium]